MTAKSMATSGFRWRSAAFSEIFDNKNRSLIENIYYALIHLGHSLIKLESLYRYLRKFHASGPRRYALVSMRHIPAALVVLLAGIHAAATASAAIGAWSATTKLDCLAGGPLLGALKLVEAEHGKLAGDDPRQRVQGMSDPCLIGHYRDSLEGRMMRQDSAQAQL
jgi:hypothetical protein